MAASEIGETWVGAFPINVAPLGTANGPEGCSRAHDATKVMEIAATIQTAAMRKGKRTTKLPSPSWPRDRRPPGAKPDAKELCGPLSRASKVEATDRRAAG